MLAIACVGVSVMAAATKQGQCRFISCPVALLFSIELKVAKLVNASRNIIDKVYNELC